MATATVKTVQVIDHRIEPQPDPVYDYVIGPVQNQFYKNTVSGKSNSSLTFNNFTTLGVDRAYLDTFEIELSATITFTNNKAALAAEIGAGFPAEIKKLPVPTPGNWVFDSFPFNKCCEEVRVNVNGGAFFSQPLMYLRAKERYMKQYELSKSYENVCPCHKPYLQYESGKTYNSWIEESDTDQPLYSFSSISFGGTSSRSDAGAFSIPSRYGNSMFNFMMSDQGAEGGFNNSILQLGRQLDSGTGTDGQSANNIPCFENYRIDGDNGEKTVVHVTWREPIFCSPFSSRYDATYGRPLYNITSLDFNFQLQSLGNMVRVMQDEGNYLFTVNETDYRCYVTNIDVNIDSAQICYQVMTIPPSIQKPLTTLVPYRRFVPYITEISEEINLQGQKTNNVPSGVYTLNEIPTAIWVFCAPVKSTYQQNKEDVTNTHAVYDGYDADTDTGAHGNWDSNKLFAYIENLSISMANTTQILSTAKKPDLYRIAKANGCEDSYVSWGLYDTLCPKNLFHSRHNLPTAALYNNSHLPCRFPYGAGSVLRLIPGVDLLVPDQALIPGANANNMVFQVAESYWYIPPRSPVQQKYALWLLFEYVGVAAISPGQCEITMNPLGSGEIMAQSPVISATSAETEGTIDDMGGREIVKKTARIAAQIANEGILSKILKHIPGAEGVAKYAAEHGFGAPASKRGRTCGSGEGGAVIGRGLNEWV